MEVVFNTELLRENGEHLQEEEATSPENGEHQQEEEASSTKNGEHLQEEEAPENREHLQDEEASSPLSDWVISIKGKLDKACQDDGASSWDNLSIYKVPQYLRNSTGDDKAYVPQIVSLGPYHHGKEHLRQMERHKWRSLNHVLRRTGHDISLYLNSMKEIEDKVRSFYEGPIPLSSYEFVEMLVLDGCFVLEVLRGFSLGFEELDYSSNDPVFAMGSSMHSFIREDMVMLENQLPLFVLDRLLGLQFGNPDLKGRVAGLAVLSFHRLMQEDKPLTQSERTNLISLLDNRRTFNPLSDLDGLHCLDIFRKILLRTEPQLTPRVTNAESNNHTGSDKQWQQLIYCVTELKEAGIKFKKRETDRFWDIKFEKGILQIPRLLIEDRTNSLFLNLIAFEQCHLDCSDDITAYVFFMDCLMNSSKDVGYLHNCGIIEHLLGSDEEVAEIFNGLSRNVVFDINESYLCTTSRNLNQYYERRWNRWYANLRHNYFSNPWTIISLMAAVVLLLLTFAQTYYTVYAYYKSPK